MPDEDTVREQNHETPSLRELAMVLFRQRRTFLFVAAGVLAAAFFYAMTGARYQAHMKVMVRPGRADAPVTAQENAPLDLTHLTISEEALNSEVELLRDDEVLRKVAEENGPMGRDWLHLFRMEEGREQRIERAARRLAKKIQVEPIRKTNLISVSYRSDDPKQAARVLQSVASVYLKKHTMVHRPEGTARFFDQQTAESRRQLDAAQDKLLQFTTAHRVVAAAQERDLILQRLSDVDARHRETRIELAETQQRVLELEEKLKNLPQRATTQIRTADNPELLKALKSTLLDLQLKRIQLLTKFDPSHRLVSEVEQQIARTESAVAAESLAPVRDETTDKSTHYEWGQSELEKSQVQLKALQARAAASEAQIIAYRSMAKKLGEDAIAQDDLQSTEKAAEENYLLYLKKQEEARMADALDQRGIVNVAIAEQPAVPALPIWSVWAILAAGFLAAGVAGTGAAFVADYLDPAFRTPEDVVSCLNAPVLASLPCETRWLQA